MAKSIKLTNDTYWDSSNIIHQQTKLDDILNFDEKIVKVGTWYGRTLYRISVSISIMSKGNQTIYTLPKGAIIKICNAWYYKNNSQYSNLVNWNADTKGSDFGVLYYNRNTHQIMINTQDTGYLQLVVYYTIE